MRSSGAGYAMRKLVWEAAERGERVFVVSSGGMKYPKDALWRNRSALWYYEDFLRYDEDAAIPEAVWKSL